MKVIFNHSFCSHCSSETKLQIKTRYSRASSSVQRLIAALLKNIYLSRHLQPFQNLKYQEKCLFKCLLDQFRKSVAQIAKVSSRCLPYFLAAMLVSLGGTPTWWLHTGLSKFVQNISTIISRPGKRTEQEFGEVS